MCNQRMSSQNKCSFDKNVNHDLSLYVVILLILLICVVIEPGVLVQVQTLTDYLCLPWR